VPAPRHAGGSLVKIAPARDWLDHADRFFAGFANVLTFGGSNHLREAMWGQTAT